MKTHIYDKWNPWTTKSENVKFKTTDKAIGHGEQKLAMEYSTKPLGQNYSYDLRIGNEKWECKKLDLDGSFRIGVESQTKYSELVSSVVNLLDNVKSIIPLLLEGQIKNELVIVESKTYRIPRGQSRTSLYAGLKKSEVSASNLKKANEVIEKLISLSNYDGKVRNIKLFSPIGEKKNYCIEDAYELLKLDDAKQDFMTEKLGVNYNLAILRSATRGIDIFEESSLKERLNEIVRELFYDKTLVFVDETKGYKPVTDLSKIVCYRITSGAPRCKYIS